ncbi:hypothetical protein B0H34DRAFT_529246 [Crassisporium funariophilum]|nr:hypothetical protein B0H34DRAFT_529246 [Crassisporium funariophilum]
MATADTSMQRSNWLDNSLLHDIASNLDIPCLKHIHSRADAFRITPRTSKDFPQPQTLTLDQSKSRANRSRVTVVCLECKRLKLKCGRQGPCQSCTKQNTASQCINPPEAAEKVDLQLLISRLPQVEVNMCTPTTLPQTPAALSEPSLDELEWSHPPNNTLDVDMENPYKTLLPGSSSSPSIFATPPDYLQWIALNTCLETRPYVPAMLSGHHDRTLLGQFESGPSTNFHAVLFRALDDARPRKAVLASAKVLLASVRRRPSRTRVRAVALLIGIHYCDLQHGAHRISRIRNVERSLQADCPGMVLSLASPAWKKRPRPTSHPSCFNAATPIHIIQFHITPLLRQYDIPRQWPAGSVSC